MSKHEGCYTQLADDLTKDTLLRTLTTVLSTQVVTL
jgi:hypothetical protein